jgi:hypothetical protein
MLDSAVIDVGIALAYVFVLVSALNELLAGLLKQRSKALWQGIGDLLRAGSLRDAFYDHPLIRSIASPVSGAVLTTKSMCGPSYVPSETFAATLLDLLERPHALEKAKRLLEELKETPSGQKAKEIATRLGTLLEQVPVDPRTKEVREKLAAVVESSTPGAPIAALVEQTVERVDSFVATWTGLSREERAALYSDDLRTILRVLGEEAAGDVERLRASIEKWFDAGMDRVSGWYKRWTQLWQFGLGLLLAILLNIDMIAIGTKLWTDVPYRDAVVAEAAAYAARAPVDGDAALDPTKQIEDVRTLLDKAALPIGWQHGFFTSGSLEGTMIPGWLLTAIGASFGAPFWFDLLNKFVRLRAGGPKPKEIGRTE